MWIRTTMFCLTRCREATTLWLRSNQRATSTLFGCYVTQERLSRPCVLPPTWVLLRKSMAALAVPRPDFASLNPRLNKTEGFVKPELAATLLLTA
jgi:hypothetical protein